MIWSRNAVPITGAEYDTGLAVYLGLPGAQKLTLRVAGGSVMLQLSESLDEGDWPEPLTTEALLEPGFHSRALSTRAYAFRLRGLGTPTTLWATASG